MRRLLLLTLCPLALSSIAQETNAPDEIRVVATQLGGNVYGIDGQGGRAAALIGPEGVLLVDTQFARVSDRLVQTIGGLTPAPVKLIVNTHVHGDHTGGNENLARLGATILGRPELRAQLLEPRPAPGDGQVPPVAPSEALPTILYEAPLTVLLNGETVEIVPLPPAHTDGDSAVKFVDADVLMTGDVFRSVGFPAAAKTNGGSFLGTLEAIEIMIAMTGPDTTVVPGHGPVADQAALIAHRDLIITVRDRIAAALREGKTADEIRASRPTADFEEAVGGPPHFIAQFVDGLIEELGAASQ